MWRKPNEAKPSSPASTTPAPAQVKAQETAQAASEQSAKTSPNTTANTSANGSTKPAASVSAAPAVEQAKAAPVATPPTPAVAAAPIAPPAPVAPSSAEPVATGVNGGSSTISAGLKIKGEITGTADLTVDGDTQGKIRIPNGRVTVGPNGRVNADIDAREIVVNGTVQGNLKATESVRLGASSHVEGSVLTPRIGIDDGARLRGAVEMTRAGEAPAAAPEPAKAAAVRAGSRED